MVRIVTLIALSKVAYVLRGYVIGDAEDLGYINLSQTQAGQEEGISPRSRLATLVAKDFTPVSPKLGGFESKLRKREGWVRGRCRRYGKGSRRWTPRCRATRSRRTRCSKGRRRGIAT